MYGYMTPLRRISIPIGVLLLFTLAPAAHACTIVPDNGSGTINGNLAPGATLTVTGTCIEDVVITHDDVTIQAGASRPII